jgi:hypothetical protein
MENFHCGKKSRQKFQRQPVAEISLLEFCHFPYNTCFLSSGGENSVHNGHQDNDRYPENLADHDQFYGQLRFKDPDVVGELVPEGPYRRGHHIASHERQDHIPMTDAGGIEQGPRRCQTGGEFGAHLQRHDPECLGIQPGQEQNMVSEKSPGLIEQSKPVEKEEQDIDGYGEAHYFPDPLLKSEPALIEGLLPGNGLARSGWLRNR